MNFELSEKEVAMLAILLKRLNDEDVTKWLSEELKTLNSLEYSDGSKNFHKNIELAYKHLENRIIEASSIKR